MRSLQMHLRASLAATILSGIYAGTLSHIWRDKDGYPEMTAKRNARMREWALSEADALICECWEPLEVPGDEDNDCNDDDSSVEVDWE